MAPHSTTLAWRIPWMEEPGGLQSMGSQRVGHDWSDLAAAVSSLSCVILGGIIKPYLSLFAMRIEDFCLCSNV